MLTPARPFRSVSNNTEQLYADLMLLHCKRTIHRSVSYFSEQLLFRESSRRESSRQCGLRTLYIVLYLRKQVVTMLNKVRDNSRINNLVEENI